MAYYDDTDPYDAPNGPGQDEPVGAYLTYTYLGQDPNGKDVYQGSDGQMYTGDANGMNGMGPYSGPGVGAPAPAPGPENTTTTAPAPAPAPTAPPPTTPPPTGAPVPPGGTPPPSTDPAPDYTAPTYTKPPAYVPPPAFHYDDFTGPSASDLFDDPGYRLRKQEGESGIERSAAARGVLNTGGNLKDILRFGQDLASQEYRGLFDRKFSTYQANRSNAFDTYKTNYGIGKDAYDTNYQTQYRDPFSYEQQGSRDAYDSRIHNYDQNQFYKSHNTDLDRMYAWNKQIQDYNATRNNRLDSFDEKYKILGLL